MGFRKTLKKAYLVTGGAGFIGSNFVRMARACGWSRIINFDKLTYAGNRISLCGLDDDVDHVFVVGDIGDGEAVRKVFDEYSPSAVINFAAESHVDRSIDSPGEFVQTNVVGTFNLLDETLRYWERMDEDGKSAFRFLHVSTDEVYGSLDMKASPFTEETSYAPNSPYSASKAASDHFVRSYWKTYGLPVLTTNCSNNYGPYQFPEKLIPLMIINCLERKQLPVYGDGSNIRDWLYVDDHCRAIHMVLQKGRVGETYNIGGRCEKTNLQVVQTLCSELDAIRPMDSGESYTSLITYVKDRPGHDRRYAIDDSKIASELDWNPKESFESGINKTIKWYLDNHEWVNSVRDGSYRDWISKQYAERGCK